MLELLYTSNKTVTPGILIYIASWDAFLLNNSGVLYKVFRDGSQVYMGTISNTGGVTGLATRAGGKHILASPFGQPGYMYACNEISAQTTWEVLNPNALIGGHYIDDYAGVIITRTNPLGFYRLSDGALLGTLPLDLTPDQIAYVRRGQAVTIRYSTGQVYFVDYVLRTVLWVTSVSPCSSAAYDCTHNLVVTVQADGKIRLYLEKAVPSILSNPTFTNTPGQFLGSQVKVRLTGSNGEPCPAYKINWQITSDPVKGQLEKSFSLTDQDGYAKNYYFGDMLGSETIQTSVNI